MLERRGEGKPVHPEKTSRCTVENQQALQIKSNTDKPQTKKVEVAKYDLLGYQSCPVQVSQLVISSEIKRVWIERKPLYQREALKMSAFQSFMVEF